MRVASCCAVAASFLVLAVAALCSPPAAAETIQVNGAKGHPGLALAAQTPAGVDLRFGMDSFELDALAIGDQEYRKISLAGALLPNNAGAPDLPSLSGWVAVPQGARAVVEVVSAQTQVFEGVRVSPAPVIPSDNDDSPLVYAEDAAIYGRDAQYPDSPVMVSEPTQIRGVDAVLVGVTPFQYNPVTQELVVYTNIEVRVDFVGGNGQFGENRLRSRFWEPILQEHLLNYGSLPAVAFDGAPDRERYGWEYVIITPTDAGFVAWADSLKAWRKLQGITTEVFTTAQTGTTAAQIESFLNTAYNTWEVPPAAFMILADYPSSGEGRDTAITSPMYSGYCVSDNIYADVNGDDLPDMVHGRITARNAAELGTMLNKMFSYERHPYTDAGFYDHPLIAGGWQTDRWFILCAETIYGHQVNVLGKSPVREYAICSGTPGTVWSTNQNTSIVVAYFGPSGLGYIPATPQHLTDWGGNATRINADINAGAYLAIHRDHGYEPGWGEPNYTTTHLDALTNDMYPFVFSINCLSGKYNYADECFAEKIHRIAHGALGVIAASESSMSFVNDAFVWGMFDCLWHGFLPDYGPQPIDTDFRFPAFAMASGKYFLQASSWPSNPGDKALTHHLFHHHGDAFLTMYTEVPQYMTVVHDGVCFVGVDVFTIQADAGSLISLTVDGEIIGVATATGQPQDIPILPQADPGMLRITVTKPDFFRHDEQIPIIPPAGPYVSVGRKTVDDDLLGGSAGNADGAFDAGETIEFIVNLRNVGTETATNVRATLATADEYVTITDNYETYGDIAAGGENPPAEDFDLVVAPGCPDGHVVQFTVTVESDNRTTWEKDISMPVEAPVIGLSAWAISDTAGNNNGRIEPGETVTVTATLANTGSEDATNVAATLTVSSGYVTIGQAAGTLALLPAAGTGVLAPPFEITVAANCPDPDLLMSHLGVDADWGQGGQLDFGLPVGGFWDDIEAGAGGWASYVVTSGFVNEWHQSTLRAYSPTHSWKCGATAAGGTYASLSDGALESESCTLRPTSWLKFRHWMDAEVSGAYAGYCYDGGLVEASINGGAWQQIFPVGNYTHRIRAGSTPGPLPAETQVYSGTFDWMPAVFEINDSEGQIRFRFRFTSDGADQQEGWYVDNVELFGYGVDVTGVDVQPVALRPALDQNRPNPFGTGTGIVFQLPAGAPVNLRIFDTAGRLVRTLVDGRQEAGQHLVSWDGRDDAGCSVGSGVYYYRFEMGGISETRKMILSR